LKPSSDLQFYDLVCQSQMVYSDEFYDCEDGITLSVIVFFIFKLMI